ncbi:MAG TPA: HD domain-containing protein, partial [Anaeromyxobacteraceae bacterium]|nr:HD domain-containing protein [Anaeromyxobacteraceae bacterium]
MEKTWVKDIKEGERVKAIFAVARKAVPTAKSGKTYLAATLVDRTGELEARSFDRVEELAALFDEKDLVEVEGAVGSFQGRPQLRIETVARVDAAAAAIDLAEFAWVPPPEPRKPEKAPESDAGDATWTELLGLVEAITDPHVKDLVKAFLADDDVASRLRRAPAAKTVHHAYPGGLLEHTVSCIKLSHRVADQYPQLDRDLLVAGAFFHDIGKIRELGYERNVEYTDEGRLVGHLVMAAQWIHEKARRVGVPRDLEQHVVHLVLAHHGKLEYGSPKTPATLEALVTHFIDDLDSRMNSWVGLMGREGGTRRWTDAQNVHGHHIWRGTLPTVQVEKRSPPPELMTPVIYVPRPAAPGSQPQRRQQEKKQKPPRPPRPERAEARAAGETGAPP